MSAKRDSPRRVTLAMMKGKPIATSVPAFRYHASDDELEELYPSSDDEKRLTPDIEKSSPGQPSSPAKTSEKKAAISREDVSEDSRVDPSMLQEGTPPTSDPWKVFSDIRGKITKTFEEKLCEMKSDKRRKSRSPKENSSISDSEEHGDVTPSEENSLEKQKKDTSTRRRGLATHYVGFSKVKTGLKDKTTRDECVESGVEAAEYSEDAYESVVFGLDADPMEKRLSSGTATCVEGQSRSSIVRTPVQILPVTSPSFTNLETIFTRLNNQLVYPLAYRCVVFLTIVICCYYLMPISQYLLGFAVGVFVTATFFNAIAIATEVLTNFPEETASVQHQAVPVLEIPAVEEHAVVERFEGWVNELPYAYDPEDYHVARTKSVYFKLEGDILRVMETRVKIPKRAVWDEARQKLKFTKRRAYCLAGAQVELLPQGLIRRRRWSKKYPICIIMKKEALISNVTLKRSIKDVNIQDAEPCRKSDIRKRRNFKRLGTSDKENDEKAKQKEDESDCVNNDRKEKRKDFSDISETTETSPLEEEEDEDDEGDDTLDGQEFDEEFEEDEYEGEYEGEGEEEDELDWDVEMDNAGDYDCENHPVEEKQQQSPVREPKERRHSDRSDTGYDDPKETKSEAVENEPSLDVDGKGKSELKDVKDAFLKEDVKEEGQKNTSAVDDVTDGKESIQLVRRGGLRSKALKKLLREGHDSEAPNAEIKLFIFARADRQKEDWYRRLVSATSWHATKRNRSASPINVTSTDSKHNISTNYSSDSSSELSLHAYMAKYLDSRLTPSPDPASSICDNVVWFNSLVARILFDMHKCPDTISLIQDKIQRKLSNIKLPYFMECLLVSEIVIGQGAPVIRNVTKPINDDRGFWMDLDLIYKGSLTMTVETKLNLMKLTKTGAVSNNTNDVFGIETQKTMTRSPMFHSEVEDTPETSTEDEDSTKMRMCGPNKETQTPSSGRKFLSMVDKIAANKYFQHATELSYVRRAMEGVSNTEIRLMVTVSGIEGCLSVNIPPPPSDRLWYGFKPVPKINLTVKPALGERAVNIVYVTKWIEAKLLREFEKIVVLPNMDDLMLPLCPNYPYMTTTTTTTAATTR